MTPPTLLRVWLRDTFVGRLRFSEGATAFWLDDEYRRLPHRPVLGQYFEDHPMRSFRQSARLPAWFSNLLPEGRMREVVAAGNDVSEHAEFGLLAALGVDLPGALRLEVDAGATSIDGPPPAPERTTGADELGSNLLTIKFSLAGVQLKLSMTRDDDRYVLPAQDGRGDYIVKFPPRSYPSTVENECAMLRWATLVGITAAEAEIIHLDADLLQRLPPSFGGDPSSNLLAVKRFDRSPEGLVHMEEFNQVLWQFPEKKYEGISFEKLGRLIKTLCGPDDFDEFVRRFVFAALVGDEDNHLKNWSVSYPDGVNPRLSPAYDIVSTVVYPDLSRGLALKFFDSKRLTSISRDNLARLGERCEVGSERVLDIADRVCAGTVEQRGDLLRASLPDTLSAALVEHQDGVLRRLQR